ncbi:hypothetical protein LSH36_195g02008 [Paralvinella palmiformis]|uniref:THAP-type domain-containing protein n=1 Tax=Paralvinella palmiformis TaxID=53620 RepID=A0AAD9JS70_9ANNE|nr:hypothetical protein LSH36_195g02008 [Paralvinella palmiformis]
MPTCCCIYGCHKRGGHGFPTDRARCKGWVDAIRRVEDKKGHMWWPSATSVVCHEHFKQDDYVQQTFIGKPQTTDKSLKGNAIPVISLGVWHHHHPVKKEERELFEDRESVYWKILNRKKA